MINLLPPVEKEELLLRERQNLILILGILLLLFLVSLSLILFSIKISLAGDLEIQKITLKELEKEVFSSQGLEEKIKNSNQLLFNLHSFYQNQFSLTQILEKISGLLPPGVYLTNVNFTHPQKEKGFQVSLSGFCPDRETLISFKKNLEMEKNFSEIYFPPENWLKPNDINFNVTFILK
jgi:Tfp pilus assembly protein PilN